jgi:predicted RNase H-like HicB family nuclease
MHGDRTIIKTLEGLLPRLLNCRAAPADGATRQEAVGNAEIVTNGFIETARELGRPVPEPKGKLLLA